MFDTSSKHVSPTLLDGMRLLQIQRLREALEDYDSVSGYDFVGLLLFIQLVANIRACDTSEECTLSLLEVTDCSALQTDP